MRVLRRTDNPRAQRATLGTMSTPGHRTTALAGRPVHPILDVQRTLGNKAVQRLIQAKLTTSSPKDIHEQEGDRASEQVMRTPVRVNFRAKGINAGGADRSEAPPLVHDVLRSPGNTLDRTTRQFFEQRFGHDFSRVRLHADAMAEESPESIQATAHTAGNDMVFSAGQYSPSPDSGKQLLRHELADVVQQGEGVARQPDKPGKGSEEKGEEETPRTEERGAEEAEKKAEAEKAGKLASLGVAAPAAGTCDPVGLSRADFLKAVAILDPSGNYGIEVGKDAPPLGLTILQGHASIPAVVLEPGAKSGVTVATTGASLPPIYSIYTKTSFREGTYKVRDTDAAGCSNKTNDLPVQWLMSTAGEKAIAAAEKEHCDDFIAIAQVMQHYANIINSKLAGKTFKSDKDAGKPLEKLKKKHGIPSNDEIVDTFRAMVDASKKRDSRGLHSSPVTAAEVKPDPKFRGRYDCFLTVHITGGFPSGLGSLLTADLYKKYAGIDISKILKGKP